MASVRLSMQSSSGDPCVQVDGVLRDRLDQMEDVQPKHALSPFGFFDLDVEPAPQAGSGSQSDPEMRPARLRLESDGFVVDGLGADRDQMVAPESVVTGYSCVLHLPVQRGANV